MPISNLNDFFSLNRIQVTIFDSGNYVSKFAQNVQSVKGRNSIPNLFGKFSSKTKTGKVEVRQYQNDWFQTRVEHSIILSMLSKNTSRTEIAQY